jgi:aromatic-L-amino-acid/L-tryptophan decarboxylase
MLRNFDDENLFEHLNNGIEQSIEPGSNEETLDPTDWHTVSELGHRMLDDMLYYLETVRQRPVWQPLPVETRARFRSPMPTEPAGAEQVYQEFVNNVLPYALGNIHPRFWGWVCGTGSATGMLAEMLSSAMNSSGFGCEQSAIYVESQVIDWFKQLYNFPSDASGILVTGGTMANLVGLTVARNTKAGIDIAKEGVAAIPQKMIIYGSVEMHSSIQKSMELLGLGSNSIHKIPVDNQYRIDIAALRVAIASDRAKGYLPFCVVGNAGTVNTGAFDNLNEIAAICREENLWFHVDGAFGALAKLSNSVNHFTIGMEQADSLAFDLHKWMYMPYDVGCALVRHADKHHKSFSTSASYLTNFNRGITAGPRWFSEYGLELSRGFRALKVWMLIKEHGIDKYRRLIDQNIAQAVYLAKSIENNLQLELAAPVPLNVICFRFIDSNLTNEQLNDLNREILYRLQEDGVAVPSSTVLQGRFVLRLAITNHRSRREDFDILVEKVIELGRSLVKDQLMIGDRA